MAGPHTWVGSASGVFNLAANWDTGLIPANGETAILPASYTAPCTDGTGMGAVDLAELRIESGHTADIGSVGAELTISADKIIHRGSGTLHFIEGAGTTDIIEVDSPNKVLAARIAGTTATLLINNRGAVEVTGTVTTFISNSMSNLSSDADTTFTTASTVGTIIGNGGFITVNSNNNTSKIQANPGCTINIVSSGAVTHTLIENNGGTISVKPSGTTTTTITLTNAFGGTTTLSGSGKITQTAGNAYTPAAVNIGPNVTLTADIQTHGNPRINWPLGKAVGY